MRNFLNPRWIFIVNTIPSLLLLFIFWRDYSIVKSQIDSHDAWVWLSGALLLLTLLNALYASYSILKKEKVNAVYSLVAIPVYIAYLYVFGYYSEELIPRAIPAWMVSDSLLVYAGTFLMPAIIYPLLVAVIRSTTWPKLDKVLHNPGMNFLAAVMVPLASFLLFMVLTPLWKLVESDFSSHLIIVCFIIGVIFFLFFLLRVVYLLASKHGEKWLKYELFWKIPIAIVFPLMGLVINGMAPYDFFGDFGSMWFYVLAAVNGIVLCLPNGKHATYRFVLFALRSVTLAFTFYFFLVFLPFLPFSLLAILAFGLGFLMLVPLVLFVIHVSALSKDMTFLRASFSATRLKLLGIGCFLLIPATITSVFLYHRNTLTTTLDYLYSPDYSRSYAIDTTSMQLTMLQVQANKSANKDPFLGRRTPYITSYFNWLVFDNLTLSDEKIALISDIFDNRLAVKQTLPQPVPNMVSDQKVSSRMKASSHFDEKQHAWISQLDMELTNTNDSVAWGGDEYRTTFTLPTGCWISDYYLYVGDRKESGLLAEKKTAMWVYSNIRNERKDPGILYYRTGNQVAFSVYPFAQEEVRKTGIELIHKEPVQLTIDGQTLVLGDTGKLRTNHIAEGEVLYLSAQDKLQLPLVQRKPYFHFLIDRSYAVADKSEEYIHRIEKWIAQSEISSKDAQVSMVNSYATTIAMDNSWQGELRRYPCSGGFFLERGITKALFDSYESKADRYPVLVVVTDNMDNAIIQKNFADLAFTYPETDRFYHLSNNGALIEYSLANPFEAIGETAKPIVDKMVRAYPNSQSPVAYLPNNNEPSIVLRNDLFEMDEKDIHEKDWQTGLQLQGKWMSHNLHPEVAKQEWQSFVKYSFLSHFMTPVTSYLVVENDAQKAILLRKQQEVLSGDKHYDLGDETQSMSEPEIIVLLGLLVLALGYRKYKRRLQRR